MLHNRDIDQEVIVHVHQLAPPLDSLGSRQLGGSRPLPARRTVINAVARFNPLRERLADARARYELACPR